MSWRPGSSCQPERLTTAFTSTAAPHAGQERELPSVTLPHQGQGELRPGEPAAGDLDWGDAGSRFVIAPSLLRGVVDVHGLDADAAGAGHAGEVHAGAAEEAAGQLDRFDVHGHRGILVEEGPRLDQDALPRFQGPLEDV